MGARDRRHFLGWDRTPLAAAAEWLLAEIGEDLGDVVVALPGARARQGLEEQLARRAGPGWRPPLLLTHGQLSDELVQFDRPVAGRLLRTLAWERALEELPPLELARIARRTGRPELTERVQLAETVRALHAELAPEGVGFQAFTEGDARPESDGEAARWKALAMAQKRYQARLERLGVIDPHEGRLAAIAAGHVDRGRRVVLVGVADMNHLLRRLLEALDDRVTALVIAPSEVSEGFDPWGAVRTEWWKERDLPLDLERWHVVEKPVDQADRLVDVVAGWKGRFAAQELAVGVADEQVVPYLGRRLAGLGVDVRIAAGAKIAHTRPFRLLAALARFLTRRGYAEFAALVRHPDLERALRRDGMLQRIDLAAALDEYQNRHLPALADGTWVVDKKCTPKVRAVLDEVLRLLDVLAVEERRLSEWAGPLRDFLGKVYRMDLDPDVEPERVLAAALSQFGEMLGELEDVPRALGGSETSASGTIDLLLGQLRAHAVPAAESRGDTPTVELLGWLDLPLDEAPALIVTGFNDGRVPESVQGDAFLPDGVRRRLGLVNDDDRLARDAYAANVILASREVVFISGRRSGEGDPLVPSRLAFHAPAETIEGRVRRFLQSGGGARAAALDTTGVRKYVPPLLPGAPVETMSVSSFKTYLASPYRFYLERVMRLQTLDDKARELDPMRFGILMHDVLEDFGRSDHRDSSDEEALADWLTAAVDERVRATYGSGPLPAVLLQAEQIKFRLRHFARIQARRAQEGWRIRHVEWKPEQGGIVPFDVDGEPMGISGRIDRIDHHPVHGFAILDYKTGEQTVPEKVHARRDGTWVDLQLPLYVHLVHASPELGIEGLPGLGYVALGKNAATIGFHMAKDWGPDDIDDAHAKAREVVRCVRAGEFRDVGKLPYDPIPLAICGQGLIGVGALEEDA